ncbi:MAG TPA: hypothetical protein VJ733_13690, partial [Candidatus Binatia bacterium]|nr:hypothetical protein [Candidatus Binatia bacterium]
DAVRYPATDSVKEWADEILALDQLLVEGFLLKPLQKLAEDGGRTFDAKWGSLRVLQEVLVARGHAEEEAKNVVLSLQQLHALRTEVRGHATIEKKRAAESKARTNSRTLREDFQKLVSRCEGSFNLVIASLGANPKR